MSHIFSNIHNFAIKHTTCNKLAVGAGYISDNLDKPVYTCNKSEQYNCKLHSKCYKAELTGIYESCEETRKYCKAIHAEINMINYLKNNKIDPSNGILYITRYPCLNCAKSCIEFGFKHIVYCGLQEISDEVKELFNRANIKVEWLRNIDYEY